MQMTADTSNTICQPFCNRPSPWINQEKNICYGAKDGKYATFRFKQDCQLVAVRLVHVSGYVSCADRLDTYHSFWGCYEDNVISTVLVNLRVSDRIWFPGPVAESNGGSYQIDGFYRNDDVLIMKKKGNFTLGDELQVWYGEDFMDHSEHDNGGLHCVDVDVSCLI